jgi:hypothetical protein
MRLCKRFTLPILAFEVGLHEGALEAVKLCISRLSAKCENSGEGRSTSLLVLDIEPIAKSRLLALVSYIDFCIGVAVVGPRVQRHNLVNGKIYWILCQ